MDRDALEVVQVRKNRLEVGIDIAVCSQPREMTASNTTSGIETEIVGGHVAHDDTTIGQNGRADIAEFATCCMPANAVGAKRFV